MRDHCGYKLAVATLQYSRCPGKHSESHTQFDTIRKLRSAYGNWVKASPHTNQQHPVLNDDGSKVVRIIYDLSLLLWFQHFNAGMKYRMRLIWKPNKALSMELILKVIQRAEEQEVYTKIRRSNMAGLYLWTILYYRTL